MGEPLSPRPILIETLQSLPPTVHAETHTGASAPNETPGAPRTSGPSDREGRYRELMERSLGRAVVEAFGEAIGAHENVLVAGKTTLCDALLLEMTERFPRERVVVLEDTGELQCRAEDHLALRTSDEVSLSDIVGFTLRCTPDRIVVGEVRDAAALDLLDAWATGHPGGCATLHATTARGALHRLDRLAQRANVPPRHALVAEAVVLSCCSSRAETMTAASARSSAAGHDETDYRLEPV